MQALDLNLASRPFRNNTLLWVTYILAVLFLSVFTWWNVDGFGKHQQLLTDLRDKVTNFKRRMSEYDMRDERARLGIKKYDLESLMVQASKANDVIQWKAFSWTRLFNLLEQVQPYKVRMLSIRPVFYASERRAVENGAPTGSVPVRVQGIAEDIKWFLAFERSLLLDPHFDRVEPERETTVEGKEKQFELGFLYFPEQIEEAERLDIPPVIERSNPTEFAQAEAEEHAAEDGARVDEDEAVQEAAGDEEMVGNRESLSAGGAG